LIQPLYDKVVLDPIKEEQVTTSGFIIAGDADKPQEATVVAVGTGVTTSNGVHVEIPLAVGDKVLFAKYSGTDVRHENKDYIVISYNDILAVLDEQD
jgi:chaperonin GroES